VSPSSAAELAELIAAQNSRGEGIRTVDLSRLNRILELAPADMTVSVQSGITLGALQTELAAHGQCLPIDPPSPNAISIHEVLSKNLSGPRRFGYGTIREHLIGMKVILANGRLIKSGGKVVKNVAGYDLAKLFIGARDSLGIIVEATFKVRPLPELERIVSAHVNATSINQILPAVLNSDLTPAILDVHQLAGAAQATVVLGFAGTKAEVAWQCGVAQSLGFASAATLEYEAEFWSDDSVTHRISVLPSRLAETIAELHSRPCVARAGNGVVYYRGEKLPREKQLPAELMQRVKAAYDPKNIFPEFTT
jgi:glycolate oxidase FAD binding subunit